MTQRQYAWNVQPSSVTVHFPDGDYFVWSSAHPHYSAVKAAIREGADGSVIRELTNVVEQIADVMETCALPGLKVTREGITYNGESINFAVVERILSLLSEGFTAAPQIRYLEKVLQNPSHRAVTCLYTFMEKNDIPLTEDGDFIVYKRVRGDYYDIHSGKFNNAPGQTPEVPRWKVEEDPNLTCAKGLHVCSRTYLPHFGSESRGDRIVICKVNPADVVAVPYDYNNAKMRVCKYHVIGELNDIERAKVIDEAALLHPDDFADDDAVEWHDSYYDYDEDEDYGEDVVDEDEADVEIVIPASDKETVLSVQELLRKLQGKN